MSLEPEMCDETVMEGGRRFMVLRRKEEVDAARLRQEKEKDNETGKVLIVHGSVEPAKQHQFA